MSGEAILSVENGGKFQGSRGSAPNPAGRAKSTPQTASWRGGGLAAPPQEPYPALGLWKFGLYIFGLGPNEKSLRNNQQNATTFYRATLCVSAIFAVARCPSVCHDRAFYPGRKIERSGKILRFSTEIAVYLGNGTR